MIAESAQSEAWRQTPDVSRGRKLAFGVGAVADQLGMSGPNSMAAPLLNITLGVNPWIVGTVLGAARIWDAFTNPVIGAISDNARTRFGRRRPFILGGAIVSGLIFLLMWCAPRGWSPNGYAIFFSIAFILFYTAFDVFSVPYHALGYELTTSYHGRTQVMAYRMIFSIVALVMAGWLFPCTQWPGFADPIAGMHWVGAAAGVVIACAGATTGVFSREHAPAIVAPVKIGALESLRYSLANRTFSQLAVVALLTLVAGAIFGSLSLYVNIYYVHSGRVVDASLVQGTVTTVGLALTFASIPFWAGLARRIGKISVLKIGSAMILIGSLLQFFVFNPAFPWLQIVAYFFINPGSIAIWLTIHAMVGDICDGDDLRTGVRREGMYGAILAWIQKIGMSISAVLAGGLLSWSGFDKELGGAQSPIALLILRASIIAIPAIAALGVFLIIRQYPLTEDVVLEMQTKLAARKASLRPSSS
jgi:glycoside/pentoside/hexuronide:cation symporter, GPH family